jgi:hypothetical protein
VAELLDAMREEVADMVGGVSTEVRAAAEENAVAAVAEEVREESAGAEEPEEAAGAVALLPRVDEATEDVDSGGVGTPGDEGDDRLLLSLRELVDDEEEAGEEAALVAALRALLELDEGGGGSAAVEEEEEEEDDAVAGQKCSTYTASAAWAGRLCAGSKRCRYVWLRLGSSRGYSTR